jgi:class 3 adenylate cyclase/tetratricopeptide (TPR) repeat protein
MICSQCQAENPSDASFCDQCGLPLDPCCPHCNERNRANARFCKKCGQRLDSSAAPAPARGEAGSGRTIVPRHLAEKILASRRFIEGERKQVTVLFADIRGSTSLIEKLDPEEVRRLFDPILHIMMDAVHRYEGTVNQVLGDGVMALFGAPLAHEDHAVRACYAALAMQEQMRRNTEKPGSTPGALKIGVGINSGEVVVRSVTNDLNIDYSALGHTTHLAARMEDLAPAGSIWITAETLREVEGFVEVRPLGNLRVKGFSDPISAFELTGVTAARNRLQAAASRGLSTFVGREAEVETFQNLTERTSARGGSVLALVGEAGMGKSRLVQEFVQHHLPAGWRALEAFSVSYGEATPFLPVTELLKNYFSLSAQDERASIRNKVSQQVLQLDGALEETIAPMLSLLDAVPEAAGANGSGRWSLSEPQRAASAALARFAAMEPQEKRARTFQALLKLFARESQRQPLLMIFEDLHWIDGETQTFLDALVEELPRTRILLLVDYRPGYSHRWETKDYYTRIRIEPLPSHSASSLLDSLLGCREELASLKELLIKRTEGNPFFIEEIVRSLAETNILAGTKGSYRLNMAVDNIRIPSTVRTVLADRVDRLPPEEKQLLQTAAVIGVVVPWRPLAAVSATPENQLVEYLADLQASEFLYESDLFPELKYTFTHALTNEVVYNALLHERRTALHAAIMSAIEAIAGDNLGEHIESLAHHAYHGEIWDKAVRYLQEAGAKAMSRSAFLEASSSYERALAAVERLPESREKAAQQIDLHLEARNVLFLLGDLPRVGEHLQKAEALADRLGDETRMARVLNFLNSYYGLAGDPERAIEIGERALRLGAVQAEVASSTVTYYYLGAAYNKIGAYGRAIEALLRGIQNVEGDLRHERFGTAAVLSVICRSHLVQSLALTGRFDEGIRWGEEGVRIGEETDHPVSLLHVNCSLGVLYLVKGEFERAVSVLGRAMMICQEKQIPVYVPLVAPRLGVAYLQLGRIGEALPFLERGVDESASAGRVGFLSLHTAWRAEGYLLDGRADEAQKLAERAYEFSIQHKERGHGALALKLLGDIALRRDGPDSEAAESYFRQVIALGGEMGMRPLEAHARLALGGVLRARGAIEEARREMAAAARLYEALEMKPWQPIAKAALEGVG